LYVEVSIEFLDRLINEERSAQHSLYRMFSSRMFGICLRYAPNPDVAKDILQDGFVKVFTSIRTFRSQGSFEGWMRRIMVNTALEYHRKRSDNNEVTLDVAEGLDGGHHETEHDYTFFLDVVSRLPEQYRLVFNLYAIEGYSHKEIADMLSITESTSKSNFSRARSLLRKELERLNVYSYDEFL
jgi:RNA polymerase sigma-70 factor (ECF subfamily)